MSKCTKHNIKSMSRVWTSDRWVTGLMPMTNEPSCSTEYNSIANIYTHTLHNLIIQTIINTDHLSLNNKQILGGSLLNHTYRKKNYSSLVKGEKTCSVIISDRKRSRFQQNWLWGVRTTPVSVLSQFVHSIYVDDTSPPLGISLGCCLL